MLASRSSRARRAVRSAAAPAGARPARQILAHSRSARHSTVASCHGTSAACRGRPHREVAVSLLPRGHLVAVDRGHLDVDGQQVVAALGPVIATLVEEMAGRQPLALQPALHVGGSRAAPCRSSPRSTWARRSSSVIASSRVGVRGRQRPPEGIGSRPYALGFGRWTELRGRPGAARRSASVPDHGGARHRSTAGSPTATTRVTLGEGRLRGAASRPDTGPARDQPRGRTDRQRRREDASRLAHRIGEVLPIDARVPCHNDLLPGNVLLTAHDASIVLVDWEYAGWDAGCSTSPRSLGGTRQDPGLASRRVGGPAAATARAVRAGCRGRAGRPRRGGRGDRQRVEDQRRSSRPSST